MKQLVFFLIMFFFHFYVGAQSPYDIRLIGKVRDAESGVFLPGATIVCLLAKDSARVKIGLTDKNGCFEIDSISRDAYYLHVTYMGYKPLFKVVSLINAIGILDIGDVLLDRAGVALRGIDIIGSRPLVKISKDTISFSAEKYRLREHSTLEQLLKRLPGVQVDVDGVVKVNGEVVSMILVDGRPFFLNNISMATRNIQADMIENVQLIDRLIRERDPASFSGEGTEKAINITLKKNRKNIWSGELGGGHGTLHRFVAKANVTRFTDHEQLAIFVNGDNLNGATEDMSGGAGLSRIWLPGINYTKDLNDKVTYVGSYTMQNSKRENFQNSSKNTFLGDSIFFYDQNLNQNTRNASHSINSRINFKISPFWSLLYVNSIGYVVDHVEMMNEHGSYGSHRQLIDSGSFDNSLYQSSFSISNQINLNKKFRRDLYNLNVDIAYSNSYVLAQNYNLSGTLYMRSNGIHVLDTLNQYTKIDNRARDFQITTTQSLPFLGKSILSITYSLTVNKSPYSRSTYDFNPVDRHYSDLIDSLSGDFENTTIANFTRLGIEYKKGSIEYKISLSSMFFNLSGDNTTSNGHYKYTATSIIPKGSLNYGISDYKRLRILLTGNPILPSPEELRPISDNSNPLYIKKGNSNLRTGSTHGVWVTYSSFNPEKMFFFTTGLSGGYMRNQIIDAVWLDTLGRQIIQPTNVSGSYNMRVNMDFSFPVGKSKSSISTSTSAFLRRDISYMNSIMGSNIGMSLSQAVSYNYIYKDVVNLSIATSYGFNSVSYTMPSYKMIRYSSCGVSINGSFRLPLGLLIGENIAYSLNTGRGEMFNTSAFILNAFVSKSLFANKKGLIKLQGFDILNQNVNSYRVIGPGSMEDVRTNVLKRVFALSFIYYIKQNSVNK
ncbi:outer membrane beta-barrel protein [Chitinophaga polysaccharea]|uniref:outer membrane beta-barrel protein n=1 Tax=Chitinophaga polysaccharea TaxID=1293035 RepID=UPI001158F807|nr:outer membrane beta-barrel protein [Chitinophaga polysaccharea]